MARTLRTAAMIAGTIALAATGVGAIAGPALLASISATVGASVSTIATVASIVSASAGLGAQLLAKPPPTVGSVNNVTIGANQPIPYGMGRAFIAGAQLHEMGYGGTVGDVDNPYRSHVLVWSAGGPVEDIEDFLLDWQAVTFSGGNAVGFYNDFLYLDTQDGARPEGSALAGPWGNFTGWGAASKLSGYAAGLVSFKFDEDGEKWANGIPALGAVGKWARVYDWRLDTTFPGGAGSHRWDDEDSWEWDPNVSLNAIAYARGRFTDDTGSGVQVVGCGFPFGSIDWPAWTAFANLCDSNGWEVNGHVFDGPGISKWDNLKRICEAGGGKPCFTGGLLSVQFPAPVTSLDTITRDDLADGDHIVPVMRTFRERVNTVVPKYRSEPNRWELVQSTAISEAAFVAEDGEVKEMEWPIELVTNKDQAAEVAGYALWDGREIDGITLRCKPRLWEYKLGEALELDLDEFGLSGDHVITALEKDAGSGTVTLTFMTETAAKHAAVLGQTGTAPPAPGLPAHGDSDVVVGENNDVVAAGALDAIGDDQGMILYRGATVWEALAPGTAGEVLITAGAAANPAWGPPDAAGVTFYPAGDIAATDVQAAIEELDAEKLSAAEVGWEVADSWTHSGDVLGVTFAGLGVYQSLIVTLDGVTLSASGLRRLRVSTDGGSTFFTTGGDYIELAATGVESAASVVQLHNTGDAAARSMAARLDGNVAGARKTWRTARNIDVAVDATTDVIDAIRVIVDDSTINLTGGTIQILGLRRG